MSRGARARFRPALKDGEDLRAVLGDGHRVLGVRRPAAVAAADRPAVPVDPVHVPAAAQEPRLEGGDRAGADPGAAAGGTLVGHRRLLVHGPADAVAAEIGADPVAPRAPDGA